jgi:thiamine biosynthesis protein ThiS
MHFFVNGQEREFSDLTAPTLADLIAKLGLKDDRVAVEHNGSIVPRSGWTQTNLASGDKLEIVHFVGGGM